MNTFSKVLDVDKRAEVSGLTRIRFNNPSDFRLPEALVLYEGRYLPEKKIKAMCELEYRIKLECPVLNMIPKEIIEYYDGSTVVPYSVNTDTLTIDVMVMYEDYKKRVKPYKNYSVVKHLVPIYHFVKSYSKYYGLPSFLSDLAPKDVFNTIVSEAIGLGASDITITQTATSAEVYYNVRKKKVYSYRTISKKMAADIIDVISVLSNNKLLNLDSSPKYMSISLDINHRGRVVINKTYYGTMASIRVLSNGIFNLSLEELRLSNSTIKFIRKYFMSTESGLRLIVGPTSAGKNTTMASVLHEINRDNTYKVISIENPVEILMDNVEQIQAESEESYALNASSLIRSNPDIVYLSEFTERSATSIMKVVNTSKPVFSTIHANSIADVVSRLQDLTGLSYVRIIDQLHSIVFQTLHRDEATDTLIPITRCAYFSREFKESLYGLEYGDILIKLKEKERESE